MTFPGKLSKVTYGSAFESSRTKDSAPTVNKNTKTNIKRGKNARSNLCHEENGQRQFRS